MLTKPQSSSMPTGTRRIALVACAFLFPLLLSPSRADVVVLKSGRAYAGVIERLTTESVQLYDGNLRRVVDRGDVTKVIREKPDTSWVIVGDLMMEQRDWEAAGEAYGKALEQTDQPDVLLARMAQLRASRYRLPGSEKAEALLEAGDYASAAALLTEIVGRAKGVAAKHYWTDRLARAYVGLAAQAPSSDTVAVNPYLVYALAVAPTCAPAHTLLAECLARAGHGEAARSELLLALDLDPIEIRARTRIAALDATWTHDPARSDRSGLRQWVEQRRSIEPRAPAPLTTATLARVIQQRVAQLGPQPARVLLAAYLVEPTVALAYEGVLPYPGYGSIVPAVLKETATAGGTTPYDKTIIGASLKPRIDPRFVRAIARVRTECEPERVLADGARGLIPLTRRQWETAAQHTHVAWEYEQDWKDSQRNVPLAFGYLDWLRGDVLRPYVGNRLDQLERVHDNL